jgi:ParB/RepB/Spo0J family partition protein
MDTQILVPIDQIQPNPFQQTGVRDDAKVLEIAESLERNCENGAKGLHQVPTARAVNGHYELAFGHHRWYAFQHLVSQGKAFFAEMPLLVLPKNDQEMYEAMVVENFQRRDIGDIEKAKTIHDYMVKFNKNSVEAGAFFQMSPESIRDFIRLLKLPKDLQHGVEDGTINRANARRLLTVQRAAPDQVKDVAKQLKENPNADPDTVIGNALRNSGTTVEMYIPSWRQDTEILAGGNLWPIRLPAEKFPREHLPKLKAAEAAKALGTEKDETLEIWIAGLSEGTWRGADGIHEYPNGPADEYFISRGAPPDQIEKLKHLINPPSCGACPFYTRVNSMHFCTFKECYTRKAHAWRAQTLAAAVKELGIAEYSHKTDGKFVLLASYKETDKKLVRDRHADLRLKKGNGNYGSFEGVPDGFVVVAVGKTAEKLAEKEKQPSSTMDANAESYRAEQRRLGQMREANREAAYAFLWTVGTPAFAGLLESVANLPFLKEFADRMVRGVPEEEPGPKVKKAERLDFYRRALLFSLLDDALDMWDLCQKKKPVTAMAKDLQGLATTWGVKLPRNWLDQAAQADKAIPAVTAETADG